MNDNEILTRMHIDCITHEFSLRMKEVLLSPKNIKKGNSWEHCDYDYLLKRLDEEIEEWKQKPTKSELIDIANLCLFLYYRVETKR